ncbi:hypothetical protein AZE42_03948 [Rhizopogon vesiculosus]|uniref:Major facilitator superfamily (MFS) profile domain-containing protein n=1 Tax=Rhizopogon vesiculosus TaxID=180088 RepID=A0A1J8QPR6_9AGAM|nr:hypothetical protein AZE42_03948 [Rhizopogon vesiculosus]
MTRFCWGLGGVAGAIIGGSFEKPAEKWPDVFGKVPLLVDYPYLLPCAVAASVTFTGSLLSLFLGPDGGPRHGSIRLLPEKPEDRHLTIPEEEEEDDIMTPSALENASQSGFVGSIARKASSYFARDSVAAQERLSVPLTTSMSLPMDIQRPFSRINRTYGSAYGYGGSAPRPGSMIAPGGRHVSTASTIRRKRGSTFEVSTSLADTSDLNFAQRLLMANENAGTNIADLWVAAAMNVDNDETFEPEQDLDMNVNSDYIEHQDIPSSVTSSPVQRGRSIGRDFPMPGSPFAQSSRFRSPQLMDDGASFTLRPPTIFSHPGVRTPSTVLNAQARAQESTLLQPIIEHGQPVTEMEASSEKPPSLTSQLPVIVIIQYGLLALHSTTHDQVFLSYLVTDYGSGGLNLNPGHFSQLIALMCLAQIVYQFYLYPNIGQTPSRALFPSRNVPSNNEGSFVLMAALSLSTAIRYCGNTFAYTAISILLNYMTPPHAVGYANGVAQSIVSLARCIGPVLGGYLWAASTRDDPSGYPLGFLACGGVWMSISHGKTLNAGEPELTTMNPEQQPPTEKRGRGRPKESKNGPNAGTTGRPVGRPRKDGSIRVPTVPSNTSRQTALARPD